MKNDLRQYNSSEENIIEKRPPRRAPHPQHQCFQAPACGGHNDDAYLSAVSLKVPIRHDTVC